MNTSPLRKQGPTLITIKTQVRNTPERALLPYVGLSKENAGPSMKHIGPSMEHLGPLLTHYFSCVCWLARFFIFQANPVVRTFIPRVKLPLHKNTFPGFIIQLGSNRVLISFITFTPVSPISSGRSACLPHPIPCSPVQVPPKANARLKTRKFTLKHWLLET